MGKDSLKSNEQTLWHEPRVCLMGRRRQQDSVLTNLRNELQYGVPGDLVVRSTDASGSTASDLVNDEASAEKACDSVVQTNPAAAAILRSEIAAGRSFLDTMAIYPEFFKK
jgi:hypothetical protein